MVIETSVNRVIILRFDSFQQQQQQSFEVQGGLYVFTAKSGYVRLVLNILIIDTNIIQKSLKNTFFLKVIRV